ncbi:CARDB domain-containing protein [Halovivax gelatinilyticus]|uniref:CARDB domain-containing protein n=1 Tax=Halovivax gelatinilyticus TaxID=2961597 RepID=UPI0020CA29A9|nr:CARDB domain-containing protein [Halovivax gelatinilyticus]
MYPIDSLSRHRDAAAAVGTVVVVALLVLSVVAVGAPVAASDEQPPPPPAAYYGELTIDGEPAPPGTLVTAKIDGETRGSIVTTEAGQFGGPGMADEKLSVEGEYGDDGAVVEFFVNGEPVDSAPSPVEWEAESVEAVDLEGWDVPHPDVDVTVDEAASVTTVPPGEGAIVEVTLENTGDAGAVPIALDIDGEPTEERILELPSGESTTTFAPSFDAEGAYEAVVRSPQHADEVTIVVDEDADPPDDSPGLPPPPPDAEIEVVDTAVNESEIVAGEAVAVEATVENTGTVVETVEIPLYADDEPVDNVTVELTAGETANVTYETAFDESGQYELFVADERVETLSVSEPALEITDTQLDPRTIEPGESVEIAATVENPAGVAVEETIEIRVDETVIDEVSLTLDPGATETISYSHTIDADGEFDVTIGEVDAGTVSVQEGDDYERPDDDDDGIPGFGLGVAIVSMFAFALVRLWRHRG